MSITESKTIKSGPGRLPGHFKQRVVRSPKVEEVAGTLSRLGLHSVCEEARCPNRNHCYSEGTATFLIMGGSCTRSCGFCAVKTGLPSQPPDPAEAAQICEKAGADSVVMHLREDRRHINDQDIQRLRKTVQTRFNLEMSLNKEIVAIARSVRPDQATLVPERRAELTTEGGLDVARHFRRIQGASDALKGAGIEVSLFIDPVQRQIDGAKAVGVGMIELHTGGYDRARTKVQIRRGLEKLQRMTQYARSLGLTVNAGHGLKYHNVKAVARIPGMEELNIGHSIITRAMFVGLEAAVREMRGIVRG